MNHDTAFIVFTTCFYSSVGFVPPEVWCSHIYHETYAEFNKISHLLFVHAHLPISIFVFDTTYWYLIPISRVYTAMSPQNLERLRGFISVQQGVEGLKYAEVLGCCWEVIGRTPNKWFSATVNKFEKHPFFIFLFSFVPILTKVIHVVKWLWRSCFGREKIIAYFYGVLVTSHWRMFFLWWVYHINPHFKDFFKILLFAVAYGQLFEADQSATATACQWTCRL